MAPHGFRDDCDLCAGSLHLAAGDATVKGLADALAHMRPALVVTTSHGVTPSGAGASELGLLVDQDEQLVRPTRVLEAWRPGGAIWYAHACCSAGSDGSRQYDGLAEAGTSLERALAAIGQLVGPRVAPFPTALLSASPPLRAFIGHVEPTFNWTLRNPETGEVLTSSIEKLLYTGMFRQQPDPVGLALHDYYEPLGALWDDWGRAASEASGTSSARGAERRADARKRARYAQLTALDRQAMVILGDPTVCVPALQPR